MSDSGAGGAGGTFTLFAVPDSVPESIRTLGDGVAVNPVAAPADVGRPETPAVFLLDEHLQADGLAGLPEHVVVVTSGQAATAAAEAAGRFFMSLDDAAGAEAQRRLLRAAAHHSASLLHARMAREMLEERRMEVTELNKIGLALMSERDPERLLGLILTQARRLTTSDAGSLYLVETGEDGSQRLHFLRSQNDTLPELASPDFTLPLDESSIAGYAACTGEPLVIDDVYEIPEGLPFSFNREAFDERFGYRAKSMLVVPMKDHRDRVVGVLQLINRKRDERGTVRNEQEAERWVLPFGERAVDIVSSLAGQAAVSIENNRLYRDIENLFAGFIKAAVTAIDQRDPTTSGHSVRVSSLTCDIAEVMDRIDAGPFREVSFSREQMKELRYAGLLHDFGKVGVREEVLVKAKKLPPVMLERIESRFAFIQRTLEMEFHRRKAEYLAEHGTRGFEEYLQALEEEFRESMERVRAFHQAIRESNEPRILPEASAEVLHEIGQATFVNLDGEQVPYLSSDEIHFLSIPKGSLDPDERKQIESHVTHTFNFLRQIPWTEELSGVAEIAYGHHEKLDGTGYPRGISGEVIPIQTRIMTVSDIFDALTASDRPYKRALPSERALEILEMEGEHGQLDPRVVEVLVESRVYRRILEEDWRNL